MKKKKITKKEVKRIQKKGENQMDMDKWMKKNMTAQSIKNAEKKSKKIIKKIEKEKKK